MAFDYQKELYNESQLIRWNDYITEPELRVRQEILDKLQAKAIGLTRAASDRNPQQQIAEQLLGVLEQYDLDKLPWSFSSEVIELDLLMQDTYRFARRGFVMLDIEQVRADGEGISKGLDFLLSMHVLLTCDKTSADEYEALHIFREAHPMITQELLPVMITCCDTNPHADAALQAYQRCLYSVRDMIDQMRLTDYFNLFMSRYYEQRMISKPIKRRKPPFTTTPDQCEADAVIEQRIARHQAAISQIDKVAAALLLPEWCNGVLQRTRQLHARAVDLNRVHGAQSLLLQVIHSKELRTACALWNAARNYAAAAKNRSYRLCRCLPMLERGLDAALFNELRDQKNRGMVTVLMDDAVVRKNDLGTLLFTTRKSRYPKTDSLCIIRRWSSASPLVAGEKFAQNLFGGGLFLFLHGVGIAIDPGPDYLGNLIFYTPFEFNDINVVVVTHSHDDHDASTRALLSLSYERTRNPTFEDEHAVGGIDYVVMEAEPDPRTYIPLQVSTCVIRDVCRPKRDCQKEQLCFKNFGGVKKLHYLSLSRKNDEKEIRIDREAGKIRIKPVSVKHCFRQNMTSAGILVSIEYDDGEEVRIGYTSDTEYFDDGEFGKPLWETFNSSHILVANICSATYPDVFLQQPPSNHLGVTGILKMVERMENKPEVLILNEWALQGAGVDYRLETARYIKARFCERGYHTQVLVGEIGLRIVCEKTGAIGVIGACRHGVLNTCLPHEVEQKKTDPEDLKELIRTTSDCKHEI